MEAETKPSTTVFARRSSEEIPARTAGSRKRCISSPWDVDVGEEASEDGVGVDAFGLGVEVEQEPVSQDGEGDGGDVVVRDVVVLAGERAGLWRRGR